MNIIPIIELLPLDKRTIEDVQARIVDAYRAVFTGKGSQDDAGIVLTDMAWFAKWVETPELTLTAEQALALAQRRAGFSRTLEALTRAGVEVRGLHEALLVHPAEET